MHKILLVAAVAALAGCSQETAAPPAEEANVAVAEADQATPAAFSMNETSWDHADEGKAQNTSIDAAGNYETVAGEQHIDHGKFAMVDGKGCFTSAMNQEGPECWTISPVEIGQSFDSTSDKGNTLTVKRVAYRPFKASA